MSNKFKILFIDVLDHSIKFQSSYPHLGIGYLISYLSRHFNDLEIKVIDNRALEHFNSFRPQIVAISSVTQNYNMTIGISRQLKKIDPSCPIVIGGVHISQLPYSLDRSMDIAVLEEGEETFLELIKTIRGEVDYKLKLDSIKSLAFWKEGKVIVTGKRDIILPLDKIPHPNRSLLPNRENQLLLTSRGCPYKCAFCASSHYWDKVRYFSVDYVLEEIEQIIQQFPILNLFIFDDLFVFDKKRLADISGRIMKAGIHKKVNFWCTARANHIDEESIEYLKRMNIKGVGMGLESGSDKILKQLKGNSVSVEINQKAIDLCKINNIFVHGSFMLGCPYENEEDMHKTYEFIKTSGIDKGDITVATPLPGTVFWEYALKEKFVSEDMDWSKLAYRYTDSLPQMGNFLLLSKEVSKEKFIKIFKEITEIFIAKRKDYEKRWSQVQGAEIKLQNIFSFLIFKKLLNDPLRGLRYALAYLKSRLKLIP